MLVVEALKDAAYYNLVTFRKSGDQVVTPIWAAYLDGYFYAFSAGNAGKVKRLKNSSKALFGPCTAKGKPMGVNHPAQAFLVSDEKEIEAAYEALRAKYGWQLKLFDLGSRLGGKYHQRAMLKIQVGQS